MSQTPTFRLGRRAALAGLFAAVTVLAGCAEGPFVAAKPPREVPTASFVFFDKNSAMLSDESQALLADLASFMTEYDDLTLTIVGQRAKDEKPKKGEAGIDEMRAIAVGKELSLRGVATERLTISARGTAENMADAAGGDQSVDRRVDLMFKKSGL